MSKPQVSTFCHLITARGGYRTAPGDPVSARDALLRFRTDISEHGAPFSPGNAAPHGPAAPPSDNF